MKLSDDTAFNSEIRPLDPVDPSPTPEEWLIALETAAMREFDYRCRIKGIPINKAARAAYTIFMMDLAVHRLF